MRRLPLCGALALATAAAAPARAQLVRSYRAFEPALNPWIGSAIFGSRIRVGNTTFKYSGSLTLGLRAERPLTRRVGLLVDGSISPLAQVTASGPGIAVPREGRVLVYRADAGFGWRFKPLAPVFFFLGGGVVGGPRLDPDASGSNLDPNVAYGLGYDGGLHGSWGIRAAYMGYFVFPDTPPAPPSGPPAVAKSVAHDWSLQLGVRYMIHHRP